MTIFSYTDSSIEVRHKLDKNPIMQQFYMHAHKSYELYYFISGDGYYTVEGTNYPLSPGLVLLMHEGEVHKIHISQKFPYERIVINFHADAIIKSSAPIGSLLYDHELGHGNMFCDSTVSDEEKEFIGVLIHSVCRTDIPSEDYRNYVYGVLRIIFYELIKQSKSREQSNAEKAELLPAKDDDLVSCMVTYINANLTEITGLEELEREFFFSRCYLNNLFKNSTGSTIWEYVLLKRLLAARALLREGIPAAVAASKCGFTDYSSFYRQYRARFGISPIADKSHKKNASLT